MVAQMTSVFSSAPQVLILGSGIAGLSAALKFARSPEVQVTLVCKADPAEGATRYAQGGIASVWSKSDSFAEHRQDTLVAGAGLCHQKIVELCVSDGPARVRELIDWGVQFTKTSKGSDPTEVFDLHREGGHGQRRILHADDLTGWAIEKSLLENCRKIPNIRILENHIAIDLIVQKQRQKGAYILDMQSGEIRTLAADVTVLATGGAGKVYLYTSNPDIATGDGIAMAYRAGARVANLEFMQFHPTCLYHPSAKNFLISEALRGEGAVLKNLAGEDFMSRHHPMGSLAPRDIVARAIDMELKRTGDKHVWLDSSPVIAKSGKPELIKKFPNIHEQCLGFGIDITEGLIPVVPAAHYICGGVLVDDNAQSSLKGLYAVGETACTGLHGANRLASNSLLEAVVFAERAVTHAQPLLALRTSASTLPAPLPDWDHGRAVELEEKIDIAATWLEIRSLMWNYVGIVRSDRRLAMAKRRLDLIKNEVNATYWNYLLTKDLIELRNLLTVADLIVQCATLRKESRGLHYTVDHPEIDERHFKHDTVI